MAPNSAALQQQTAEVLRLLSRAQAVFGGGAPPADPPTFAPPRDLENNLGLGFFGTPGAPHGGATIQPVDFGGLAGPSPLPPQPLPPAPPGKEWHYYALGGWRLEDALKPCSGQHEFWDGVMAGGGLLAAIGGGPWGILGGIGAAGAALDDLGHCAPPGG